ncbi:hypothetical protein D9615_007628 [Tricholomella constricta]|uniref:Uncharacterized protein n=1 Tax=Tricholomella constricta TaxID=117010 RepID=A0A8H5H781_9AGAR|nr:hypothetical protein D9615_007628 [Tricholomella constricta]
MVAFQAQTYVNLAKLSFYLDIAFATGFAADVVVAITLCITFSKNLNGIPRTDSVLNALIAYTVNTIYVHWPVS